MTSLSVNLASRNVGSDQFILKDQVQQGTQIAISVASQVESYINATTFSPVVKHALRMAWHAVRYRMDPYFGIACVCH